MGWPFTRKTAGPAPAAQPPKSLRECLQNLRELAPEPWLPDLDRAIERLAERDYWIVWHFLERAAASNRGTAFGQEADRLAERAQRLDAENWRPAPPPPVSQAPGYW